MKNYISDNEKLINEMIVSFSNKKNIRKIKITAIMYDLYVMNFNRFLIIESEAKRKMTKEQVKDYLYIFDIITNYELYKKK